MHVRVMRTATAGAGENRLENIQMMKKNLLGMVKGRGVAIIIFLCVETSAENGYPDQS